MRGWSAKNVGWGGDGGWSAKSVGWGGDGGWSAKSGRLVGGWVAKGGRWRGPVGMWPVGGGAERG